MLIETRGTGFGIRAGIGGQPRHHSVVRVPSERGLSCVHAAARVACRELKCAPVVTLISGITNESVCERSNRTGSSNSHKASLACFIDGNLCAAGGPVFNSNSFLISRVAIEQCPSWCGLHGRGAVADRADKLNSRRLSATKP